MILQKVLLKQIGDNYFCFAPGIK